MRVLMVSQRMPPHLGGAELQAAGLAASLERAGAEVEIVTTRHARGLARTDSVGSVPLIRLASPRSGVPSPARHAWHAARMATHLGRRAYGFDVVHAHCLSASTIGAIAGARSAGVPVVLKPSLGGPDGEVANAVRLLGRGLTARILRSMDRLFVLDPEIGDELVDAGADPSALEPVANGYDPERFYPASPAERRSARRRLGLPAGPLALFAGQLIERKGVADLLQAWRHVSGVLPGATLVVAGSGDERLAREVAASEAVGLGDRSDIDALMRAADLLVLPSFNESFGNVVIEAMACGLPVVVGPTGVARREAIDGRAGIVIEPGDARSISTALVALLGRPGLAAAMGAQGRRIASRFDFAGVAAHYLDVYRSLVRDPAWALT